MIELEGSVEERNLAGGATAPIRLSRSGSLVTTDAHARYYEAVSRGNVYYLATGAAAPTAFTGGAGGTPLLGVYNPVGSGYNLVFLTASFAITAIPTAAGVVNPELWSGVSVLPTGTQTVPTSALTQLGAGSVARGFVNTATTASTAVTIAAALGSFWWATAAAGAQTSPGLYDLGGSIVASPGVLVAFGVRTVPTALTASVSISWEEIPIYA